MVCIILSLGMISCMPGDLGRAVTGWSPVVYDADESLLITVDQNGYIHAFNDNGYDGLNPAWKYPQSKDDRLIGAFNPPLIHGNFVLVTGASGDIYSLNKTNRSFSDGGWRAPESLGKDLVPIYGGPAISPDGNTVYVVDVGVDDNGNRGQLQGYDTETGKPLDWVFTAEGPIWGTPVTEQDRIYFGSHDKNFYSVDTATGLVDWSFPTNGAVVSKPSISEQLVLFGSFDRNLYAIEKNSGVLRWTFQGPNWFWATPTISGTTIYVASMNGTLHALDHNGNELWVYDHKEPIVSSPLITNSGIVIVSIEGKLSLLDSTPQDIGDSREKSTLELGNNGYKAPMIADNEYIYVPSQRDHLKKLRVSSAGFNEIWCYDLEEEQFCE